VSQGAAPASKDPTQLKWEAVRKRAREAQPSMPGDIRATLTGNVQQWEDSPIGASGSGMSIMTSTVAPKGMTYTASNLVR